MKRLIRSATGSNYNDSSVFDNVDYSEFDNEQLEQIKLGTSAGLDVGMYADPSFDAEQMSRIRMGLAKRLPVSIYADPKFNWRQMDQILDGLESGVNVNLYADPEFNWAQMMEIREGLESGVDVDTYLDSIFDSSQMEQIKLGLESGVDVSLYDDPNFDWDEMRNTRLYLEKVETTIDKVKAALRSEGNGATVLGGDSHDFYSVWVRESEPRYAVYEQDTRVWKRDSYTESSPVYFNSLEEVAKWLVDN